MAELPHGTVTFLYTDIEGSTRLWERQPRAMRAAVDRHLALLRAAVAASGGHVFRSTGDGLCAAFATAPAAVRAALVAQQALLADPSEDVGPVRGRMAIHTGAATIQYGDYVGACLNRLGRLLAVGYGGQVLLSQATADLVREDLPDGAGLSDLGEQRLRDLAGAERVYQLLHPDLPADFPALRSLNASPNNLPLQLTSFVGREQEVAAVTRALGATRLLTLTGSGGCGKTRLALRVAVEVLEQYPDGVWLAELAPLAGSALVPATVAAAIGVREQPGQPLQATLLQALGKKRLLLLLDNCEHLLDACAQLADAVLRTCPDVQILATSREALGVSGETSRRVPSLSLPPPGPTPPTFAQATQSEAVHLFVERAKATQSGFTLTDRNAAAVVQVCRRLDGIPLALELAAVRVRALSIEQLATRLDERFRLLTGGNRTALPRQQTLRAAIDWSYDLLGEAERRFFDGLAVFAGGWTLEAAEAVCVGEGIEGADVLDLLARLVDKSLVLAEEQPDGTTCYRLLETLRQYGLDHLAAMGEAEAVLKRHARYYLALGEEAERHLTGSQQVDWLGRLTVDFDNLRTAVAWCLEHGQAEVGLRLAGAIFWHAYLRGSVVEGRAWLERLLALEPAIPSAVRATAMSWTGVLALLEGSRAEGRAWLEGGLAMARARGEDGATALATLWMGYGAETEGDLDAARRLYEESLAGFRELGDHWGAAEALCRLGRLAFGRGEGAPARALLEDALATARLAGDRRTSGFAQQWLGVLAGTADDDVTAQRLLMESIGLFGELGDRSGISISQRFLGLFAHRRGDYTASADWYRASILLTRDGALGPDRIITALEGLAAALAALDQPQRALSLAAACAGLREARAWPSSRVWPERDLLHRALPCAHRAVDASIVEAACAEGRAMTLEQAVAVALEESATTVNPSA